MADLFLSYSHEDIKLAETLAQLLEAVGVTVWWDRRMIAGDKMHDVIDEEIEKAKAVVVLWSPISVKSDWVLGEAQTAHELKKLVPIKIDECKLPINYRSIHTPEIYKSKVELDKLAKALSDKFRPRQATAEPSTATKIEFTDIPSADFLSKLAADKVAFEKEIGSRLKRYSLIKPDVPISGIRRFGLILLTAVVALYVLTFLVGILLGMAELWMR
jgi:hypothetical protein